MPRLERGQPLLRPTAGDARRKRIQPCERVRVREDPGFLEARARVVNRSERSTGAGVKRVADAT